MDENKGLEPQKLAVDLRSYYCVGCSCAGQGGGGLLVITNGYVVNQELIANLAPIVYSTRVPYILNKSTEIQGVGSDFFLICCRTPVKLSHF
jgi:hypothetical protein